RERGLPLPQRAQEQLVADHRPSGVAHGLTDADDPLIEVAIDGRVDMRGHARNCRSEAPECDQTAATLNAWAFSTKRSTSASPSAFASTRSASRRSATTSR